MANKSNLGPKGYSRRVRHDTVRFGQFGHRQFTEALCVRYNRRAAIIARAASDSDRIDAITQNVLAADGRLIFSFFFMMMICIRRIARSAVCVVAFACRWY